MEWIYDDPFSDKERKVYILLEKRIANKDVAEKSVKLISLYGFLKRQKFKSADDIQKSIFFDKAKTKPVFDSVTSKKVFHSLKQKGGSVSVYPFTDYLAKRIINSIMSILPDFVTYPLNNIYNLLTFPLLTIKEQVPILDILLTMVHGTIQTTVASVEDIAQGFGGIIGAAIVTPFIAVATAIASTISILEKDLGQAVMYMAITVPVIGTALSKFIEKMEHNADKFKEHQTIASYVPVVGDYVQKSKSVGGKRFSTQKRRHTKWRRTRRTKSEKI